MADPFSLAAGIVALLATANRIVNGLSKLAETWEDAPQDFLSIRMSMEHMIYCLGTAMSLIEEHSSLYTNEIKSMLSDIAWQFKLLQDVVDKCLRGNIKKWITRLQWLFQKQRIKGFMTKLEALKSSVSLVLQVAQLAKEQGGLSRFKNYRISKLRQDAISTIKQARNQTLRLAVQGYTPHLIENQQDRKLVKYEEQPIDMANWLAVKLSAPPSEKAVGDSSQSHLQVLPSISALPALLPIKKPTWTKGSSKSSYMFKADEVNTGLVERYGIKSEMRSPRQINGALTMNTVEITKPHDPLPFKPYELQMVASLSAVSQSIPKRGWSIDKSPFWVLEPATTLDRLLQQWTTLKEAQVREILVGDFDTNTKSREGEELAFEIDGDSDGDQDGDHNEDEEADTVFLSGDENQEPSPGPPQHPPTPPSNNLGRPWSNSNEDAHWMEEVRPYLGSRRPNIPAKTSKMPAHQAYVEEERNAAAPDNQGGDTSRRNPFTWLPRQSYPNAPNNHGPIPRQGEAAGYRAQFPNPFHTQPWGQHVNPEPFAQNYHPGAHMPWPNAQPYYHPYGFPANPVQQPFHNLNAPPHNQAEANKDSFDLQQTIKELEEGIAKRYQAERDRDQEIERFRNREREVENEREKEREKLENEKEKFIREDAVKTYQKTLREKEDERNRLKEELLRETEITQDRETRMRVKMEKEIRASINMETQRQEEEKSRFRLEMEIELAREKLWKLEKAESKPKQSSGPERTTETDRPWLEAALHQTALQEHQAKLLGEIQALAGSLQRQQAELPGDIKKLVRAAVAEEKTESQLPRVEIAQPVLGALAYQVFDDWGEKQGGDDGESALSGDDNESVESDSNDKLVIDTAKRHDYAEGRQSPEGISWSILRPALITLVTAIPLYIITRQL
ncbi:hypothetical protein LIA77_00871 [Sarocladium implicatum]|nr:hypothetical protein LIA77_00871 [Sarocladium implicatum]